MSDKTRKQTITEKKKNPITASNKESVSDLLVKGEEIVLEAKIHVGIFWKTVVVFIFSVLVALMVFRLGVVLAVAAFGMFVYNVLRRQILMLVLTNKRVFVRYGILQVDVVDVRFDKIESVELERMLPGYLMGYANVVLMGTGQRLIIIPFVENAREFRAAYNRLTLADEDTL